jgi:hypothetical protein
MSILFLCAPLLLSFLQVADTSEKAATPAAPPSVAAADMTLANSPTPTDPKILLEVGRKVNGLAGPDMQPWHLKASYEVFDDVGRSKYKGTYEEWWVSGKQYKRSYQDPEFSQTEYGTDHGPLRSGNAAWLGGAIYSVRPELVDPLNGPEQRTEIEPVAADRMFGRNKLRCITVNPKVPPKGTPAQTVFPTYCFNPERPILRLFSSTNNFNQTLFNRIVLFRGHYVGGDISVTRLGKDEVKIHLDLLEPLTHVNAADFDPPTDAVAPAPRRITVGAAVTAGNILTKVQPVYPLGAKTLRVQGVVVIQAAIGKDGHILPNLRAISGPPELRDAAVDAVRRWVYKPYLLNGEPVEVGTEIHVSFSLGG